MYTFLDQCPKCHHAVRVEFTVEEGYAATHLQPGEGVGVVDILCCTCNERLDDEEDAVAACLEAAETEMEDARYPDL